MDHQISTFFISCQISVHIVILLPYLLRSHKHTCLSIAMCMYSVTYCCGRTCESGMVLGETKLVYVYSCAVSDGMVSSSWSSYMKKREELADCLATVH